MFLNSLPFFFFLLQVFRSGDVYSDALPQCKRNIYKRYNTVLVWLFFKRFLQQRPRDYNIKSSRVAFERALVAEKYQGPIRAFRVTRIVGYVPTLRQHVRVDVSERCICIGMHIVASECTHIIPYTFIAQVCTCIHDHIFTYLHNNIRLDIILCVRTSGGYDRLRCAVSHVRPPKKLTSPTDVIAAAAVTRPSSRRVSLPKDGSDTVVLRSDTRGPWIIVPTNEVPAGSPGNRIIIIIDRPCQTIIIIIIMYS